MEEHIWFTTGGSGEESYHSTLLPWQQLVMDKGRVRRDVKYEQMELTIFLL